MGCNAAKTVLVAIFGMEYEGLTDTVEKMEEMCQEKISSKIVSLATPVEDDGT